MLKVNHEKLEAISEQAKLKTGGCARWCKAIDRAVRELENNPYVAFEGDALLILSPSTNIYTANGSCQCKAYEFRRPCWHRAAARLMAIYYETERTELLCDLVERGCHSAAA